MRNNELAAYLNQKNSILKSVNISIIVILLLLSLFCISAVSAEAGTPAPTSNRELEYIRDTTGPDDGTSISDRTGNDPDDGNNPDRTMIAEDEGSEVDPEVEGDRTPEDPDEIEDNRDTTNGDGGENNVSPTTPDVTTPPPASPFYDEEPDSSNGESSSNDEHEEDSGEPYSQNEQEQNGYNNIEGLNEINIEIDNMECFLFDLDKDQVYDTFVNPYTKVITSIEQTEKGSYLIDTKGNGKWDYIYSSADGAVVLINNKQDTNQENLIPPYMLYVLVLLSTLVVLILFYWNYRDQKKMSNQTNTFE